MARWSSVASSKGQAAIARRSAASRNLQGQVATEFFLYVSVFMFMAIAAFFIINAVQSSEIPRTEGTIAKDTGNLFASSITMAVKNGNGFTYEYTFPRTILDGPYTLSFSTENGNHFMVLDWEGRYGNFSESYDLPGYRYKFPPGGCIDPSAQTPDVFVFQSSRQGCSDTLTLSNDGENLTIVNGAS